MPDQNSLVIFTKAALLLAEADTIQKAKELKTLALTAGEWSKRKNMGEAAIQHCRSYALEAERKMGEMLAATERAKGKRTDLVTSGDQVTKKPGMAPFFFTEDDKIRDQVDREREARYRERPTLAQLGLTKNESSKAQKLAALPRETFNAIVSGDKPRTTAHVGHNSGDNEWYTPATIIAAAREAMGGIDCDPASSKIANETVKASRFFTVAEDGLAQKWCGAVWLNPPYSQPLITHFSAAVAVKFQSGEIEQACVLVNNATETAWFSAIARQSSAICFPSSRIKFIDPTGAPSGAPLQGQAILYLGQNKAAFTKTFKTFGLVCHVV